MILLRIPSASLSSKFKQFLMISVLPVSAFPTSMAYFPFLTILSSR